MPSKEVTEFFKSLHLHKKYVMEAGVIVGGIPEERLFYHDASKFGEAEYPHYARQFHGDKGDPHGFALAWLHHIHHNPHHWQHWVFPDGYAPAGSQSEDGVMPMPEAYLREMVADWLGASLAYTGSWDMSPWLNRHLSKMKLHTETRTILDEVLSSIGYRYTDNSSQLVLSDWSKYPNRR